MKRKLIPQGKGGLTIYLPQTWVKENNLKGGNEIEITEDKRKLIVTLDPQLSKDKKIEVDITGLDRSSFLKIFTTLYENGYDEIKFKFKNENTPDFKSHHQIKLSEYIPYYITRFEGMIIIHQTKDSYVAKDISVSSDKEFDNLLRRIFFLIMEFNETIIKSLEQNDLSNLSKGQERHDNITRLVSYCIRVLNKRNTEENIKPHLFHILSLLDLITDYHKYLCQDLISIKKPSKELVSLIKEISKGMRGVYDYYYTPTTEKLIELSKQKYVLREKIHKAILPKEEFSLLVRYSSTNEIFSSLVSSIIAVNNYPAD